MRLLSLTCDQPSFHPITFNREGKLAIEVIPAAFDAVAAR